MRRSSFPSFVCVGACALTSMTGPPACGGATSAFTTPSGGATENGSEDSGSSGGSGGGGLDATLDTGGMTSADDATTPPDASMGGQESTDAGDAAPGAGDAAPDAPGRGVLCPQGSQASYCASGQSCCVTTTTGLLGTTTQTNTCQSSTCSGAVVHCAAQADCQAGEICCGTEDTTGTSYQEVTCATTCTTGVFATRVQFCDPTADVCPSGTTCRTSTVIQGYTVCR